MASLADAQSLREAFQPFFRVGAAVPSTEGLPEDETALLTRHFVSVTPENLMKPEALQPREGTFRFEAADAFLDRAKQLGLEVHGHTLVWHAQCPEWFFRDGASPASRELVLERMRKHITTVAGRYRGRIARWDVVNEAISDGPEFLRPSKWFEATGEDFLVEAFKSAHAADPQARLFYNDYQIESGAKRGKTLRLLRLLSDRGAPVHGVGIQGHWSIDEVPFDDIERAIIAFHAEGLRVAVTELDIDVVPRRVAGADISVRDRATEDPYAKGCPDEVLQRQAEQYARLFTLFRKHADKLDLVTFWGLHDGRSWLNGWPRQRTNYPLLWDRELKPKPALDAVLRAALE
jgi:endo-1,4-beta-xylanase